MKPGLKIIGILNKKSVATMLAVLIFLPLLFLNIRHDHDWGGDFAQYLSQADNIAHFRSMSKTGYVYNEYYPSLAPKAYPPGFPLLIAPLVSLYGNYIPPFNYLTSFLLIATAVLTVLLLKQRFGLLTAIALSLIVFYNPYMVMFKSEVMADIPFSLMFAGFILLTLTTERFTTRRWIVAGLIAGLATATKTAGISLLAALLIYALQLFISGLLKKENLTNALKPARGPLLGMVAGFGLSLLLSFIFMRGEQGSASYLNTFSIQGLTNTITTNIYGYSEALRGFFTGMNTPAQWFGLLTGSAILTFFITGLVIAIAHTPGLKEWTILIYFGLLLVYPYHNAGFRFLIPVALLIIFYAAQAVFSLQPGKGGAVLAIIVAAMMLSDYYPRLVIIQQSTRIVQDGPYASQVVNAFQKVKLVTPGDALIVFNKPTVLARYTGRSSMSVKPGSTADEISGQLAGKKPTHYLIYTGLPDPALELYLVTNSAGIELLWQDQFFRLYRQR